MNLATAYLAFLTRHPDYEVRNSIMVGWPWVEVLEVRDGKAIVASGKYAECYFRFCAQPWSETEPGEAPGRCWIDGPIVHLKNRTRDDIKKKTGLYLIE